MRHVVVAVILFLQPVISLLLHCESEPPMALPSIIPKPVTTEVKPGVFRLSPATRILVAAPGNDLFAVGNYLADLIGRPTGYGIKVVRGTKPRSGDILLVLERDSVDIGREGYRLDVGSASVSIAGVDPIGVYHGVQTLRQLLPAAIESRTRVKGTAHWVVPCIRIVDRPRFPYRGAHVDVGRHFFSTDSIKRYIDLLALYKINTFHWHLTEDQGWRIEIKAFPRLTEIGGWRTEEDGSRYGGFYTQDEIRDVVRYAGSRFIEVIPEIEMPGHCLAALTAYPYLSCTGGPFQVTNRWGVFGDVYCAGSDSTFTFLERVLTEVMALFPGKYIHIGGDEVPKDRWKKCPRCQARIKAEGLKDEEELQSYFIKRIEKFLVAHGRRLIGWDEILEGGLAPEATVMSWRGMDGGIAAVKQNHDVIMTPGSHTYFDSHQGKPEHPARTGGGLITLTKAYSFEPVPPELQESEAKHILGAQGNLWSEDIESAAELEYMAFPRMCALAEVLWTPANLRSWDDFSRRVSDHFSRLDSLHVNYAKSSYMVAATSVVDSSKPSIVITLAAEHPGQVIRYTLDGSDPTPGSALYAGPIEVNKTTRLRAGVFRNGALYARAAEYEFIFHQAIGKSVRLIFPYAAKYDGGGPKGLTNGVRGSTVFSDGNWQGFEENDLDALVDLGEIRSIRGIKVGFLQNISSWIYFPSQVEFSISSDNWLFTPVASFANDTPVNAPGSLTKDVECQLGNVQARFIRVVGRNIRTCPPEQPGVGGKAWVFVDEIIIE